MNGFFIAFFLAFPILPSSLALSFSKTHGIQNLRLQNQ